MSDKQKNILIVCLAIALAVISWIAFKPTQIVDNTILEQRLIRLERDNDSLNLVNKNEIQKRERFEKQNDSLKSLKPKIKIKYDTIYKRIDNASVNGVINEFNNVFSNGSIK